MNTSVKSAMTLLNSGMVCQKNQTQIVLHAQGHLKNSSQEVLFTLKVEDGTLMAIAIQKNLAELAEAARQLKSLKNLTQRQLAQKVTEPHAAHNFT